jgi:Leucine-rich repeat (LRR) protein
VVQGCACRLAVVVARLRSSLEELSVHGRPLRTLPAACFDVEGLQSLEAVDCAIASLPDEQSVLKAKRLESLVLRGNALRQLPWAALAALTHLRHLDIRANPLADAANDDIARFRALRPDVDLRVH